VAADPRSDKRRTMVTESDNCAATVAAGTSSVADVLAIEPVIRRVIASRVANPEDVDDLVHDCLERLLTARARLAPETVLPFGIVTARNLVVSRARVTARRTQGAKRLRAYDEPDRPDDAVVASEARLAMIAALDRLSPQERADVLAYQDHGTRQAYIRQESPAALRVRMARTRSKLRLEYLLALRRVTLPSPLCRRVLLAVSGGDTRRQRALGAGEHLLDCPTCAALAEPLEQRSLALTAIAFPIALAAWAASKARAHPVTTTVSTGAVVAAVIAGTHLLTPTPTATSEHHQATHPLERVPSPQARTSSPSLRPPSTAKSLPASNETVTGLRIDGAPVTARSALTAMTGEEVDAADVRVEEVVTLNGFWVGPSPSARIWVELVGPRRTMHIVKGDLLTFVGTLTANSATYPARAHVTANTGAKLLTAQGAHIDVPTTAVKGG
jgi:RNA polymerase sigma factor (sigma-70 family)